MTSRPPPRTNITRSKCSVRTSRNSMSERRSRRKTWPLPSGRKWVALSRRERRGLVPVRGADPEAGPAQLFRPRATT